MGLTKRVRPSFVRQAWLVAKKDLAIELATGEIVTTAGFFAILVTIIASLSFFAGKDAQRDVAPGVIWVSIAFSSILALSRTWQREREDAAIRGLLVAPLARSAIFAGKALGVAAFVTAVELIVLPVAALFFSIDLIRFGPSLLLMMACATPGIAASGTLFGAMTIRTRARDLILASVMLPLLSPSILAGVAGTRALLGGAPFSELTDYFTLLGLFGFIFTAGGLGLFDAVIEG
ncbi:MAG: heme transporter [Polyangiaceae bacterium]|nr:heme transporter [Polyangiaceae bacterium]